MRKLIQIRIGTTILGAKIIGNSKMKLNPGNDFFGIWIRVLICLNTVSLVIDAIDVIRYAAGDRAAK